MQIGDEVYIHGYIDEIRNDVVIIRNDGGYFGTTRSEIRPNDEDVGKPCYKIYITAERHRFPNTYWDYFCDTVQCLDYWRRHIKYDGKATLYVKERPFTKSDRNKLGKTVFWTEKEAWQAIGLGYAEQTEPSTDCPWK